MIVADVGYINILITVIHVKMTIKRTAKIGLHYSQHRQTKARRLYVQCRRILTEDPLRPSTFFHAILAETSQPINLQAMNLSTNL